MRGVRKRDDCPKLRPCRSNLEWEGSGGLPARRCFSLSGDFPSFDQDRAELLSEGSFRQLFGESFTLIAGHIGA